MVHIVPNSQGAIYELREDGWQVTLRQIACWIEDGKLVEDIREVKWLTNLSGLRENSTTPGNIYVETSTEPISEDVEHGLWWSTGKVMRDEQGRALYRKLWVDMSSVYQMYDELKERVI